jgi:hypothetical protein
MPTGHPGHAEAAGSRRAGTVSLDAVAIPATYGGPAVAAAWHLHSCGLMTMCRQSMATS